MGKVIHWELCKKMKFVHTAKCCMHKQECFQEKRRKIWDANGSSDPGWNTRPSGNSQNWRNLISRGLCCPGKPEWKIKENKKTDKCLNLVKTVDHEGNSNSDTRYYWYIWNGLQKLGKEAGRIGNRRTNRDHTNYSSVKIGQILRRVLET